MCWDVRSGPHLEFYVYNPSRDRWWGLPEAPTDRRRAEFVEFGRQLYAVGQLAEDSGLDLFESYNPDTKEWTARSGMTIKRAKYGLIVHPQRDFPDKHILASLVMESTQ